MRSLRSIGFLLLLFVLLAVPIKSFAQFSLRITVAPPELVVYAQPVCPQEGYIWTPGYWAYGEEGYFWVPGTWIEPPTVGYLWTPGYWGWGDGVYAWNDGYWGSEVGFYGGVNYGFGYGGVGYEGGYWRNNQFSYNTSVNNVGAGNFRNTYNKTVIVNTTSTISYNGGTGGITARPSATQETAAHASHSAPTAAQSGQRQGASQNHELLASVNHGRPAIAATSKPGEFSGNNVVAARGATAENKPPVNNTAGSRATTIGANGAGANKPADFKPTPDRPVTPARAATEQPATNSVRPAQPAAKSDAPRPATPHADIKPTHSNPSAPPAHQAPAPRALSAPKPSPAQQQHQAAPRPAAAPRTEQARPSESKSDKPEGR